MNLPKNQHRKQLLFIRDTRDDLEKAITDNQKVKEIDMLTETVASFKV